MNIGLCGRSVKNRQSESFLECEAMPGGEYIRRASLLSLRTVTGAPFGRKNTQRAQKGSMVVCIHKHFIFVVLVGFESASSLS